MTIAENPARARPAAPRVEADPQLFVHFYDHDETLVESLARYLRNGLETGAAAVVIATPVHVAQLLDLWRSQGFDPEWARGRGQLTILDAAEMLASLSRDGAPAADLFAQKIE